MRQQTKKNLWLLLWVSVLLTITALGFLVRDQPLVVLYPSTEELAVNCTSDQNVMQYTEQGTFIYTETLLRCEGGIQYPTSLN